LPGDTPLGWTRGLQPDGKWSKTLAPYGEWGGFIIFADGHLEIYKSIGNQLVTFGTAQPTSDIREALPPGTRIVEYVPPPEVTARIQRHEALVKFWLPSGLLLFALACGTVIARTRWGRRNWQPLAAIMLTLGLVFYFLRATDRL